MASLTAAERQSGEAAKLPSLNWKPFIMRPLTNPNVAPPAAPADTHVVHQWTSPEFCAAVEGSEATSEFTIADLEPGVSVIAGTTTSGYWAHGVVMGWNPGKYISFDGPNVGSLLWSDFLLLRGPIADLARERYRQRYEPRDSQGDEGEASPVVPLQRTDSGTSYNFTGRPDLAFWVRSGIEPFLFVTARHYHGDLAVETKEQKEHLVWQMESELLSLRAVATAEEASPKLEIRAARHQLAVEGGVLEMLKRELRRSESTEEGGGGAA